MKKKILILFSFFCFASLAQSQTMGLIENLPGSLNDGYVLFAPLSYTNTYLIDKCGKKIHEWTSTYLPGISVYLLPDGTLLRTGCTNNSNFLIGGTGGIIERSDWNNNVIWSYTISDTVQCQHHDIKFLPNGNILALVWVSKLNATAIAAGRNPATVTGTDVWSEDIIELQPIGSDSAKIVWEWHLWDHLIQDFDGTKSNYGTVSANPQLININYRPARDWLHLNAIDYNPALDQIVISSRNLDEIYIIDHSTTTAEAASHSGGKYGKGGDILYRWGNADAYNEGTPTTHRLFGQHNPQWIKPGFPNAGKITIFNNGNGRPAGNYSTADILTPQTDSAGYYTKAHPYYGPDSDKVAYMAPVPSQFYSSFISGDQELVNGNMLICSGIYGNFFEVDSTQKIVWNYINPVSSGGPLTQGTNPTNNTSFRCTFYPDTFSGFNGHTLVPGLPIELNPIPYPAIPSNTTPTKNLTVCSGDSTSLSASGNGVISWYDSLTGGSFLGHGNTYSTANLDSNITFYAQDSSVCGIAYRTAVSVTVNSLPAITISGTTTINSGSADTLIASGTSIFYIWNNGSTNDTLIVVPATSASYTVIGIGANGCKDTASYAIIVTSVNTISLSGTTSLFPNPANDFINLSLDSQGNSIAALIAVFDETGKEVFNTHATLSYHHALPIDIRMLSTGEYFLQITTPYKTQTLKFLKE